MLGALHLGGESPEPFFWRTHGGAEADLVARLAQRLYAIELKLGARGRAERGLVECMKDLDLDRAFVLHSGSGLHPLGARIRALPARLLGDPRSLSRALRRHEACV